jgi:hypothetical protein
MDYNDNTLARAKEISATFGANFGGNNEYDVLNFCTYTIKQPGYQKKILFLTDGQIERHPEVINLAKKAVAELGVKIHALGLGSDVSRNQLKELAQAGKGSCSIVEDPNKIRENVI